LFRCNNQQQEQEDVIGSGIHYGLSAYATTWSNSLTLLLPYLLMNSTS
jgi:hypothetical protein